MARPFIFGRKKSPPKIEARIKENKTKRSGDVTTYELKLIITDYYLPMIETGFEILNTTQYPLQNPI